MEKLSQKLERLYHRFNRPEYIRPDPLQCVHRYKGLRNQEFAALIASSLAYGRVSQILTSVSAILNKIPNPESYFQDSTSLSFHQEFKGFKHRFTDSQELSQLVGGIGKAWEKYGSLEQCFLSGLNRSDDTILPALSQFVRNLGGPIPHLLPDPNKGSACKRLNLFLRWMVRKDEVDPGCWSTIPSSKLIIPLDTHMHRICLNLGLTQRRQANLKTAIDITESFRAIRLDDPVRYDFTLTRFGIRNDMSHETVLS